MMEECVALDIGGTFVKYGCFDQQGKMSAPGLFPIRETGTKEEIVNAFTAFLRAHPARRVAVSMPGPMDYDAGASLMTHKFAALYGFSLKRAFEEALPGADVRFLHDGAAFLLGEMTDGNARGLDNAAGVMLGTGLGFVRCQGGRVLLRASTMTPVGPLWNAPFGEGTAEDYVSGRGIRRRYRALCGQERDVKEIAELARAGDPTARQLFAETGAMLGQMLREHLRQTPVERVVIGGQISKSLDLLLPELRAAYPGPVMQAAHPDDAALRGAYAYSLQGARLFAILNE
ncbi:MAG: ROK family protein [Eubacteriales bacterium]|nr:ROK family protein [Eubacteriales bacterium]